MNNEVRSTPLRWWLNIPHTLYSILPHWPLGLYRVSGDSMLPRYKPGDVLVGLKWFRPKVGHVVVAQSPERIIIKRITKLDRQLVWVEGDNPAHSTDSRQFGSISRKQIQALIFFNLVRRKS